MGEQEVKELNSESLRGFTRRLIGDLQALETMLRSGAIETGVRRIGAEQELFLVDRAFNPAPLAMEMIERLGDHHFTTELARFNLEFNTDPLDFGGDCLRRMEQQLTGFLAQAREAAHSLGADVVMAGILPTLDISDLTLENMTPKPRYFALNEAMRRLRGSAYEFYIKGTDELIIRHESVMVEACNASFQAHFQVGPEEFSSLYNLTQAVAAPVLAAACNSPMLFGRRLWRETRIALFQQSVDHRAAGLHMREQERRASRSAAAGWTTRCSRSSRRTSPASRSCSPPTSRRIRSPSCAPDGFLPSRRCACTTGRSTAGRAPATASSRASRTSGSRTGSFRRDRRSSTKWRTPPSGSACSPDSRASTPTSAASWTSTPRRRTSSPRRGSGSGRSSAGRDTTTFRATS
ncbi:MAG: glutamate-cysteine ligase family protein [Thermoanaerobaculia bacterium]